VYASHAQVIDGVIHKYEEGFDGAAVFEEYETGLQALLSAYTASSPGEHFQLPQQDSSKLMQVCQAELSVLLECCHYILVTWCLLSCTIVNLAPPCYATLLPFHILGCLRTAPCKQETAGWIWIDT